MVRTGEMLVVLMGNVHQPRKDLTKTALGQLRLSFSRFCSDPARLFGVTTLNGTQTSLELL